jgi:hypothetical protein
MLKIAKSALKRLPYIRHLIEERDRLNDALAGIRRHVKHVPPGHFYSPIPNMDDLRSNADRIFGHAPRCLPGIDMREEAQLQLLQAFKPYYDEIPFGPHKTAGLRYYFDNPAYSYSDAIFLYCTIRHFRPRRIIEIGSGYSSCVVLDTNDRHFGGEIAVTFIEPFPDLLYSLTNLKDDTRVRVIGSKLQEVPLEEFAVLEANDILFVDSTHVSKVDSDVNRILLEILPILNPGVLIHFHDIFYPFEYPRAWVIDEGRAWNEAYILRAFLEYNDSFRIVLMNTFLEHFHEPMFQRDLPLCMRNPGGSIWIERCRSGLRNLVHA